MRQMGRIRRMGYETDKPNKTNKSNKANKPNRNRCKAAEYGGLTTANIYKFHITMLRLGGRQ